MLRIRHKDSYLKLAPGSIVEMERSSPLFLLENVTAEFSMPVTILYEDSNVSVLGDAFFEYGIKTKIKIEVDVYDRETFRYHCTMVIDKTITNKSQPGKGNVQGFLLTGYSDFFNTIKEKKMVDFELGGGDSFPFTSWDPFDSSNGFWQKFHATWTDNSFDYVFVPIRNESWVADETYSGWMNQLGPGVIEGGLEVPSNQMIPLTWPVPQPKLKNTLLKLFAEIGDNPTVAFFYASRALILPENAEQDLVKASQLDKNEWRYVKALAELYLGKGDAVKALSLAEPFYKNHPGNYIMVLPKVS